MAFTRDIELTNDLISDIENKIGYSFIEKSLIIQAFMRSSNHEEHNNEILEFYGDTALSFVVLKKMSEKYMYYDQDVKWIAELREQHVNRRIDNFILSSYNEGEMTEIKKSLVSTDALSGAIESLGFEKYLIMSPGDVKEGVENQPHVKEDLFEAIVGAVAIDSGWNTEILTRVVDNMLHPDKIIEKGYEYAEDYVQKLSEMINVKPKYETIETERGFEAWVKLKNYGDVEDIYGFGITEERAIQAVSKKIIDFIEFQKQILNSVDINRPGECIAMLNELSQKKLIETPIYEFYDERFQSCYGNNIWRCEITIGHSRYFEIGISKQKAKNAAAQVAICELLRIYNSGVQVCEDPSDDIKNSDFISSINKLKELIK